MASRYFNQFPGSLRFGLKFLEGTAKIGTAGAVVGNSYTGGGLSASSTVTLQNLAPGLYRLQLADPYYRCVGADIKVISPTSTYSAASSGSAADSGGNIVVGLPYQILGGTSAQLSPANPSSSMPPLAPSTSTNWYTLGLYPGLNPTVGQVFVATSGASQVPGSSAALAGQGQVARIITSGLTGIEILPGFNTTLAPTSASTGVQGAIIQFQTIGSTTALPSNPLPGTWLRWNLWLDNSTRTLYNESSTSN